MIDDTLSTSLSRKTCILYIRDFREYKIYWILFLFTSSYDVNSQGQETKP